MKRIVFSLLCVLFWRSTIVASEPSPIKVMTTNWDSRQIVFAPDSRSLVSLSVDFGDWGAVDGGSGWTQKASALQWWDVALGRLRRTVAMPGVKTLGLAIDAAGQTIATSHSNSVRLWDACTGNWKKSLKTPASVVAFSPDGRFLAAAGATIEKRDGPEVPLAITVSLWDARSLRLVRTLHGPKLGGIGNGFTSDESDRVSSLAFAPDGSLIAATAAQTVTVWNIDSGLIQKVPMVDGHELSGHEIVFSPDGATVALKYAENVFASVYTESYVLYDARTWQNRSSLRGDQVEMDRDDVAFGRGLPPQHAVAFSPDGKTVANDYRDSIVLRDTQTGQLKSTIAKHHAQALAFSPDGRTLASVYGKTIRIWPLQP